jgi:ABC-type transporter Mla subunit MlaD
MGGAARSFRVGLLVIFAGVLFFGLLVFVLGKGFGAERVSYFILFEENVKGMVIGSKANFQGVPIGTVHDIRFRKGLTEVELSVDPTRAVIQDVTRARLDRLLVTGQVTVELEGYSPTGRVLPPDSYIRPITDPLNKLKFSLPDLTEEVVGTMSAARGTLQRLDALLSGDNATHFASLLANADRTMALLPDRIERTVDRLDGLLEAAAGASRSVDAAAAAFAGAADGPETKALLADARAALSRLQLAAGAAQSMLAGMRSPFAAAIQSMRAAADEARGFLRLMRLAPESVIYGVNRSAMTPAVPGGGR